MNQLTNQCVHLWAWACQDVYEEVKGQLVRAGSPLRQCDSWELNRSHLFWLQVPLRSAEPISLALSLGVFNARFGGNWKVSRNRLGDTASVLLYGSFQCPLSAGSSVVLSWPQEVILHRKVLGLFQQNVRKFFRFLQLQILSLPRCYVWG